MMTVCGMSTALKREEKTGGETSCGVMQVGMLRGGAFATTCGGVEVVGDEATNAAT